MGKMTQDAPLVAESPPVPPEIAAQVEAYMHKPYHKVISGDRDEGFLVQVVELPGCMTAAETEAEALAQLPEAMSLWLETMLLDGNPIPEPDTEPMTGPSSGPDRPRRLRSTAGAGVGQTYSGRLHVRMPKSLHERLVHQAEREGTSLNQWVVTLLAQGAGATG